AREAPDGGRLGRGGGERAGRLRRRRERAAAGGRAARVREATRRGARAEGRRVAAAADADPADAAGARGMRPRLQGLALAASLWSAAASAAQPDPEALRQAKALFFDRQYAEARAAWQGILDSGGVKDAPAGPYWIPRCREG